MKNRFAFEPLKKDAVFRMDGYCVWDPSITYGPDFRWHLFFSRWPLSAGFEAWVTHSEVCHAVSAKPEGPYVFKRVILEKRKGFWDADMTHNPSIMTLKGRFYLFYNGNHGNGEWWTHRNNQRIGLAVADSPSGEWKRSDKPLLDVTPGSWDSKVTTNPSCAVTPDNKMIMVYKCVGDKFPAPKYGPVLHGVAFGDKPEGPFVKYPLPVFQVEGSGFPGEDPYVWSQGGRFYALLKDMETFYSKDSKAIVLFESNNGKDWVLASNPVVRNRTLEYEDGHKQEVYRLERPYFFLEKGKPLFFCYAVKPEENNEDSCICIQKISDCGIPL